jgi:IQ calmodulin-binding motif
MDDDETVMSAYMFIETVAAIVIQTAVRQFLAILCADSLRQTKEAQELADRIISIEKACTVDAVASRELNDNYAVEAHTSVQSEGDLDEVALNLYELAAVQIQAVYRGFWVRDCLDVDHYCTTVVQRAYRGFSCRMKFYRDLKRIITVQSWWRRNIARDEAANILAYVIVIQAVFRGHRVRRRYRRRREKEARAKAAAAIIIQSRWRAFVGEAHFIRKLVDVLIVQTIVRRWLAQRRMAAARKELQASKRLRESNGKPSRTWARRECTQPLRNGAARPETVSSKATVDAVGETPPNAANPERKNSTSVCVPPRRSQAIQMHPRAAPMQLSKPASKVIAYPMDIVTSRHEMHRELGENGMLVQTETNEVDYPSNVKDPDMIKTYRTVARRRPSPVADPPGLVINHASRSGRRVVASEWTVHATSKDRELPKSKAAAYPIFNGEPEHQGVSHRVDANEDIFDGEPEHQGVSHRVDANENAKYDADPKGRDAQSETGEQQPIQVKESVSDITNDILTAVSSASSEIPSIVGTSSLLSMWKEKEKKNAFVSRNLN